MNRIPVVLDVDTGVDDACALLFAARHPGIELRAVTCVDGNATLDQVVRNTLLVLEAAGAGEVPVAAGASGPLLEPRKGTRGARHVHGEDGMGDLGWPPASGRTDPRHAVELLRDELRAAADGGDRITLVPLAPLTNVALLLRCYPDVLAGLERIVFMGGAAGVGNATASAEFNVWHDPEAAAIVLDAAAQGGVPVTMYGLDVFYDVRVSRTQAEELVTSGTTSRDRGAELAGRLVSFQCDRFRNDSATVGDAGAVCAVADPDGLHTRPLPLRVELSGTWSRGRTVVDRRDWDQDMTHDPHGRAPSVDVALGVAGSRYAAKWLEVVCGPARRPP